ncbi:MAG: hypothetical protein KAR62_03105 [Sphingomonadales bacterium]|nr:hypothetical protein [Sphingomonadales bacterium]
MAEEEKDRRVVGHDRREISRMDAMDNRRQGKSKLKTKASDAIANLSSIELEEVIRNETLGDVPDDSGDDI